VRHQSAVQHRVQDDDRRLVRERTGEIECRPHRPGHKHAVPFDDLVVAQPGDMTDEHATRVVPGGRPAGDVHPVEGDVPERQPQEDRS
jgi:hypothetical protein